MSWQKINAFCIERKENWVFSGDISGQIQTVSIDTFEIVHETQAHAGSIVAMAAHPNQNFMASLAMDRTITVWEYADSGDLNLLHTVPIRDLKCSNDIKSFNFILSESQALAFHPTEKRIVTRSGNGGLVELSFTRASYEIENCFRVDPEFDIVTARYVGDSQKILVGTSHGHALLIEKGVELKRWVLSDEQVHWFEPYQENTFLIAGDSRQVIKLDITDKELPVFGERFARDDFEHICFNQETQKAYATSFDRKIYEINPETCHAIKTVFNGPFKFRWAEVLKTQPHCLIAQCRDGALYKLDLRHLGSFSKIKRTPDAVWSLVSTAEGKLVMAGEGNNCYELSPFNATSSHVKQTGFQVQKFPLNTACETYTKRLARHSQLDLIAFARTDGEILIGTVKKQKRLIKLEAAVRDLEFSSNEPCLFAACEDGKILRIGINSGQVEASFQSEYPVWSLALNPKHDLLAASNRMGNLLFLNTETLTLIKSESNNRFSKRMKWADNNRLLYGNGAHLERYDLKTSKSERLITSNGNTIEDFTWDLNQKYLMLIIYKRDVLLCDFESGILLSAVPDQMDYSKGIYFLDAGINKSGNPLEFFTFGRTGMLHQFQVHDEKIVSTGFTEVSC